NVYMNIIMIVIFLQMLEVAVVGRRLGGFSYFALDFDDEFLEDVDFAVHVLSFAVITLLTFAFILLENCKHSVNRYFSKALVNPRQKSKPTLIAAGVEGEKQQTVVSISM